MPQIWASKTYNPILPHLFRSKIYEPVSQKPQHQQARSQKTTNPEAKSQKPEAKNQPAKNQTPKPKSRSQKPNSQKPNIRKKNNIKKRTKQPSKNEQTERSTPTLLSSKTHSQRGNLSKSETPSNSTACDNSQCRQATHSSHCSSAGKPDTVEVQVPESQTLYQCRKARHGQKPLVPVPEGQTL